MAKSNEGAARDESPATRDQDQTTSMDEAADFRRASSLIRPPQPPGSERLAPVRLYQPKDFLPRKLSRIQNLGTGSLKERLETENAELRNTLVNLAIEVQVLRYGDER